MSAQQQERPRWWRVLIDVASFTLPWVVIFKQAGIMFDPPAQVSEALLWLAGAMLGVPGVSQVLVSRFGNGTGTGDSPSPAASPASPLSGPSSATSGADS